MVLLDGVPITDPDGLTRLDFIDTSLIDQVEVVKGPNSTLWGANAAGGVINMTTKSPFEREGGVAKVGVGDYATRNYHLSYSDDIAETVYYTLSGSRRESENSWRRWNEFETNQASLQGAMMFDDESTLETYFGVHQCRPSVAGKTEREPVRRSTRRPARPWRPMDPGSTLGGIQIFFSSMPSTPRKWGRGNSNPCST